MATGPSDDDLIQSILREEEQHASEEVDIEPTLADPTFRALFEKSIKRYEGILTEKAVEHARRTLAHIFTADPAAAALLVQMRERAATGEVAPESPAGKSGSRRTRRSRRS
jgi:hypothetical protein